MKNAIKNLVIFSAGLFVGSAVTVRFVEDKYKQIAQEEIDSVKEVFSKRGTKEDNVSDEQKEKAAISKDKPSVKEYAAMLQKSGYTNYGNSETSTDEKKVITDKPYVVPPEEFGEFDDYETIQLTYYSDGVLADDLDELVENVDEVVGLESLNQFGQYEEDAVHVRNDRLKADYEILRDERTYEDVSKLNYYAPASDSEE